MQALLLRNKNIDIIKDDKIIGTIPYYKQTSGLIKFILNETLIVEIYNRNIQLFHSAAVCNNNIGILLVGESGDGKSILTLEMVTNYKWLYLTDEFGLLDNSNNIIPFIKPLSYKEDIVKHNKKWVTKKFGTITQVLIPSKKQGKQTPLKAIFFVKYTPDTTPTILPIKKSESLMRLLNSQIGRAKSVATIEQMAEVVKKINSYQIFHNDVTKAARLVTDLVDTL